MSTARYRRARRDANESAVVAALEAAGGEVFLLSGPGLPDLLVRYRGRLYAFEVKAAGGVRTPAQLESNWPIVRTPAEALAAIGQLAAAAALACRTS